MRVVTFLLIVHYSFIHCGAMPSFPEVSSVSAATAGHPSRSETLGKVDYSLNGDRLSLSFEVFGLSFSVRAEITRGVFKSSYKEIVVDHKDNLTTAEALNHPPPDCFYQGTLEMSGRLNETGHAQITTCLGGVSGVLAHSFAHYELRYDRANARYTVREIIRQGTTPATPDERAKNSRVHLQAADECDGSPTKYIEILLVNDKSAYELLGADLEPRSAEIFHWIHTYIFGGQIGTTMFPGLRGDGFGCYVQPRLVGQITWREKNLAYENLQDECGIEGDCPTCRDGQVSAECMQEKARIYLPTLAVGFERVFGRVDMIQIFTAQDFIEDQFDSQVLPNRAYLGTGCMMFNGYSLAMLKINHFNSFTPMVGRAGAINVGMLLGIPRDPAPGTVMSGSWDGTEIEFATSSKQAALEWFTRDTCNDETGMFLASYSCNGRCMEEDDGPDTWRNSTCGNGFLDVGEECDPGYGHFDERDQCCLANCTLAPGCECSEADPCCKNGIILAKGHPCRPSTHSECDFEEVCTGESASCPRDRYRAPGYDCTAATIHGPEAGKCFEGLCVSASQACPEYRPYAVIVNSNTSTNDSSSGSSSISGNEFCGQMSCELFPNLDGTEIYASPFAGTSCGDGRQCFFNQTAGVQSCALSTALSAHQWYLPSCPGVAVCQNEEGIRAPSVLCDGLAPMCEKDPNVIYPRTCTTSLGAIIRGEFPGASNSDSNIQGGGSSNSSNGNNSQPAATPIYRVNCGSTVTVTRCPLRLATPCIFNDTSVNATDTNGYYTSESSVCAVARDQGIEPGTTFNLSYIAIVTNASTALCYKVDQAGDTTDTLAPTLAPTLVPAVSDSPTTGPSLATSNITLSPTISPVTISPTSGGCSGKIVIFSDGEEIVSTVNPVTRIYDNEISCRFVIAAQLIEFKYFDVQKNSDFLYVFDGNQSSFDLALADYTLTGSADPGPIVSNNGYFSFAWITDSADGSWGWHLTVYPT
uniref:Disintegrin domain-containing protein n=1 Tax=Lotharella globosa TaxID=91324 RepID=A0A7S3Z4I1_9EUKA